MTPAETNIPDHSAPAISFAIIARTRIPELDRLVDELCKVTAPTREIVVGLETPDTPRPAETVDERGVRWIALPACRGIGYNRNRVLEAVRGAIVLGVDDDCMPETGWLDGLLSAFEDPTVDAAVGSIRIPAAGFVGDSISALGFPAGGSAGYETMFHVLKDGTTNNLAAGNCAMRTQVIRDVGGFDESMTWGGEDTELAYRLGMAGKRIVYVPGATIVHPPRTSVGTFTRWLYIRGRAKAQFARKVPIRGYVGARLNSYGKILSDHKTDPKIIVIFPLLVASLVLQQAGFIAETISPTRPPCSADERRELPARSSD